jgi:ribosomal protein L37E
MYTFTCPRCQKNSYSADEKYFSPCPHCGFIFSGKYGSDRRHEERAKQETSFDFPYQEQHFGASTMDFSEKGLSIKIFGEPPIAVGNAISIPIGDPPIKAKVIWVNKLYNKSIFGLQKLN